MGKERDRQVEKYNPYDPRPSAMEAGKRLVQKLTLWDLLDGDRPDLQPVEPFDHEFFRQATQQRLQRHERTTRISENEIEIIVTESMTVIEEESRSNWERGIK